MTVCLSTNRQIVFDEPVQPTRLIVATLNGAQILERDHPDAAWRRAGLLLSGKHVSALLIEPDQRALFVGVHDSINTAIMGNATRTLLFPQHRNEVSNDDPPKSAQCH